MSWPSVRTLELRSLAPKKAMIHFFQLLLVSNWISHFYFLWDIDISLYPGVCNRDLIIDCFVQHFETVGWRMNMYLCMQLCSTLLDLQLKKCFATYGIWIFVCFCFISILQLLLKLHRTIFTMCFQSSVICLCFLKP